MVLLQNALLKVYAWFFPPHTGSPAFSEAEPSSKSFPWPAWFQGTYSTRQYVLSSCMRVPLPEGSSWHSAHKSETWVLTFNFKRWSQHYPAHCGQRLMMLHCPGGIRPLTGERELDETVLQLGLFWCRSNMCTACLCHFEFVEELKACLEMLCTRSRQSRGHWLQHMGGREKKMPRSCSGLYEDQREREQWFWKRWVQAGGRRLYALHWQAASLHHTASPAAGSEQG